MSEPNSSAVGKAGAPKKPVSPVRNIVGIVVLIAVCVAGWFQYSALAGYNAAVNALETRSQEEGKDLMTESEAAELLKKEPDDAGSDFKEGNATYTKKTYTWRGLKSYTVTAFYTKSKAPALHHFETSEKKYEAEMPPKNATTGNSGSGQAVKKEPPGNFARPPLKADDKKADDKKADDKKADDKKADDKKADDKKADDKKADDKDAKTPAKGS
jgi:hypothetical protein